MNSEQYKELEKLAKQYNIPAPHFKQACESDLSRKGISPINLIQEGAVLTNFDSYLKKGNDLYEPTEFKTINYLEDGIACNANIPTSYTFRRTLPN